MSPKQTIEKKIDHYVIQVLNLKISVVVSGDPEQKIGVADIHGFKTLLDNTSRFVNLLSS